jgi:hypothetical protein
VDLGGLVGVGGGLEGPNAPGLDAVLAPDAGDGIAADSEFAGQQPGRPVGDPQPGGWWVEGGRQDLGPAEPTDRLWSSRSGSVGEPLQPAADISAAAGDHGRAGDANALGDLGVGGAVGGQEQDAGALDEDGWQLGGPCPAVQLGPIVRGDEQRSGGGHRPWLHSNQRRSHPSPTSVPWSSTAERARPACGDRGPSSRAGGSPPSSRPGSLSWLRRPPRARHVPVDR